MVWKREEALSLSRSPTTESELQVKEAVLDPVTTLDYRCFLSSQEENWGKEIRQGCTGKEKDEKQEDHSL